MSRLSPRLLAVLVVAAMCGGASAHGAPPLPARAQVVARDSALDVNELRLSVGNLGDFAAPGTSTAGLGWPRGSGRSALYAGGLWVGARVNGETRVTVAEYASEFAAGPLDAAGQPVDPTESDPAHRVYKIRRGDNASTNPDWAQWPIAWGAPSDGAGNPRVIGDQTLWSVCNDAVASKHTVKPGGTAPLGLEVRQTVFGFDRPGPLGRMAFVELWLYNKGVNTLDSAYVGLWCDPDLGGPADDLVGCDPELGLGYAYNADDDDYAYGPHPPAVGIVLLKGPSSGGLDLPMTGFGRLLKNFLEPDTPHESYARFLGIREDGSYQACASQPTLFEVSGDPVLGPSPGDTVPPFPNPVPVEGDCVDSYPADRRFLISTGPFTFGPGSSRRVVMAIIIGGRDGIGDRLGNLERLRSYAGVAREVYGRSFENIGTAAEVDPGDSYVGYLDVPLAFNGGRTMPGSGTPPLYQWDFGDGGTTVGTNLQPTHVYHQAGNLRAKLHALGSEIPVSCGVKVTILDEPPPPPQFAFGRVFPSPARGTTQIELLVPAGTDGVDVTIHDLSGREVWRQRLTRLSPGIQVLSWDGVDRRLRRLGAGVYFVRASHAGGSASARIVRVP